MWVLVKDKFYGVNVYMYVCRQIMIIILLQVHIILVYMIYYYWKCNFPMNYVVRLMVGWLFFCCVRPGGLSWLPEKAGKCGVRNVNIVLRSDPVCVGGLVHGPPHRAGPAAVESHPGPLHLQVVTTDHHRNRVRNLTFFPLRVCLSVIYFHFDYRFVITHSIIFFLWF